VPYDVVKTVRGRSYRYRVESVRDTATGRMKARWTYLGRAEGTASDAVSPRVSSRERVLAALERLLENRSYGEITAQAVAVEAGVAHGTFYRHFAHKNEALTAAVAAVGERVDRYAAELEAPVDTLAIERERVRRWLAAVFEAKTARPGLVRAWLAFTSENPEAAAQRVQRRAQAVARVLGYVERLIAAGLCDATDARVVAHGVRVLIEGTFAEHRVPAEGSTSEDIARTIAATQRLLFGEPGAVARRRSRT
jgi:AcrR family transcriptional regulator